MLPIRNPIAVLFATAAPLLAQVPDRVLLGKAPNAQYGSSVAAAGDVDGDGHPDLIIGAAIDGRTAEKAGACEVRSGRTGALLYTWLGGGKGDELGFGVAGAGDVDADGRDDLIVGVIGGVGPERSFIGHARVYSGRSGTRLHSFDGEVFYDFHGLAVAGLGDLDGDGHAEVAVGCPGGDLRGENAGYVHVRSGRTGAVLFTQFGDAPHDQFGWFIRSIGDVDADRVSDYAIGAPGHLVAGRAGYARVFSGRSGAPLFTVRGAAAGDRMGWSLAAVGDVDGDGVPDLLVGAPFEDADGIEDAGAVGLFSGRDGAPLCAARGTEAGALFGWAVSGAGGDCDGDGVPDFWVGAKLEDARGPDSGATHLLSGRDGSRMLTIPGRSEGDESGFSVADLGPVFDRGDHMLAVGARSDDVDTGRMVGTTAIYRVRVGGADAAPQVVDGRGEVEAFTADAIRPSEAVEGARPQKRRGPSWVMFGGIGAAVLLGFTLVAAFRRRG
jgi:hypothetical protein